jgi:hypothetical protein
VAGGVQALNSRGMETAMGMSRDKRMEAAFLSSALKLFAALCPQAQGLASAALS